MIFVTVGTEKHPFDRLVAEMDRLASLDALGGETLLIQTGSCAYQPRHAETVGLLDYGAMVRTVRSARLVVSHGGAGSFMICWRFRAPMIQVPRLKRHGENVDDHQVLFCRRLASLGLLTAVEDVGELGAAIAGLLAAPRIEQRPEAGLRLVDALVALADGWRGEPPGPGN